LSVRRKENGKWEVRVLLGGRRVGRTFDYKGDADQYDTYLNRRKQLGDAAPPERDVTVAEFVPVYWRYYAVPNLVEGTRDDYKQVWGKHLLPRIGSRGLREVTPKLLTRLRADMAAAGVGDPTILKAFTMLQSVLSYAVVEGKIDANPAREVKKPAQQRTREIIPVTPERVEALRGQLLERRGGGLRDATIVSLLAYAGIRTFSEFRCLEWTDLGERGLRVTASKTGGRVRIVRLLGPLAQDLAEWRMATGRPHGRRQLMFPRADGEPWKETDWRNWRRRQFAPAAERIGIDATVPYDLRHSFASLLISEGKDVVYVSRQLGNSVETCGRNYLHLFDEFDPDAPRVTAEERIRRARDARRQRGAQ
jgi:integrase